MKKVSATKIRRVHWNSNIAVISAFCAGIALANVALIIWGGDFLLGHVFITLLMLAIGGPSIFACLQTVIFTADEVWVRIACITLRKIPISEIRTVVYLPIVPHLDRVGADYLVLSCRTQEEMRSYGEAVLASDPYIRSKLLRQGRKTEELHIKIRAYFWRKLILGFLKKEEGIWISTSMKNIKIVQNICSHAVYLTTW